MKKKLLIVNLTLILSILALTSVIKSEVIDFTLHPVWHTIDFSPIKKLRGVDYCTFPKENTCHLDNMITERYLNNFSSLKDETEQETNRDYKLPATEKSPVVEAKTVNFDNYISFIDATNIHGDAQSYVDKGYIVKDEDDYFHHNTGKFLELFLSINPGDTVIINGTTYTADYFEYAKVNAEQTNTVGYTSKKEIWLDGSPDIITCYGSIGTLERQIWHLK